MKPILNGKTALITGGGRGIGRAVAELYARAGAKVIVAARTITDVTETAAAIGSAARAAVLDVADPAGWETLIQSVPRLDILVNAAGISGPVASVEKIDPAAWDQVMAINLRGQFLGCRAVLPGFYAAGSGRIINVASGLAVRAQGEMAAYSASKAAVLQFTRVLGEEVRGKGVSVFAVHPGIVRTAMIDDQLRQSSGADEASIGARLRSLDLISPEQSARLFLFLASPLSDELSGQFVLFDDPSVLPRIEALL